MTPMLKSQKACFLSEGHSMLTASCKTIFGFADFLRKKKKVFCLDFYKPVPAELQISVTHSIKKIENVFFIVVLIILCFQMERFLYYETTCSLAT